MALKMLPTTAAVLLCFLLTYHLNPALAATGGVVGGDAWSDPDSDDSDSDSNRYSFHSDPNYRYFSDPDRYSDPRQEEGKGSGIFGWLIMGAFVVLAYKCSTNGRYTILKLQVGVSGTAKTLQKDLDQITKLGLSSGRKDLAHVMAGATEALLRHSQYCLSGYSSVDTIENMVKAVKCFNQIEKEERAKFDEETLVNVNNIKRISSTESPKSLQNEFIVVTLLVAVKGIRRFETINNSTDLTKALQNLVSIRSDNLLAVRVLWTPQQENDTLSEQDLLENYPLLKPF